MVAIYILFAVILIKKSDCFYLIITMIGRYYSLGSTPLASAIHKKVSFSHVERDDNVG